jgi:hypothetical protein
MKRLPLALQIGIGFGIAGLLLTLVGIVRGNVPPHPANIAVALLIGGGVWFLVSWAVATAAFDVESDLAEGREGDGSGGIESA